MFRLVRRNGFHLDNASITFSGSLKVYYSLLISDKIAFFIISNREPQCKKSV
ncbi:MAG: hypothetical protein IKZ88_02420 [Neisseriaceae bacterium]|nr:hypothetical protein [Neisseriaceae bacterium]MBR5940087.1 hypothetical protein [Neisseriaceae bacterium]